MTGSPSSASLPVQPAHNVEALVGWTQVIYALHAVSLVIGILGAATVVGAFLIGWPSIVAVILNYVKRSDTRGTWLESHFRWQIRTFWFGVALGGPVRACSSCSRWASACSWCGCRSASSALWFVYRVARGWLALNNRRPMYSLNTLKAIVHSQYGGPDVLRLVDVETPEPADDEILVRVHAAALNPADWHFTRGTPYPIRFGSGLKQAEDGPTTSASTMPARLPREAAPSRDSMSVTPCLAAARDRSPSI